MNEKVILYTTHCPKCKILEKKLQAANIAYEEFDDVQAMIEMGLLSAPNLGVGDKILDFKTAVDFIKQVTEGNK